MPEDELVERAAEFLNMARKRRSVRKFSDRQIPRSVIESCIAAAGTSPSGANQQPWHFVAVNDADTQREIRVAAEAEEREFYHRRAPAEWLDALAPIGTDEHKPFLETAPWLIAVFAESFRQLEGDKKGKNYYVQESVGIATGQLITALTYCGIGTLTHTPSPMRFLNQILNRPSREKPYLLLVVGYPAVDCTYPDLSKKSIDEISTFIVSEDPGKP